ncbi:MAG: DUF2142 domain-containing protein, partial [Actinomycetota bacterium]|nr:DUF2142 domain-containing protein [Actinomycetota bacterium]
MTGGHATQRPRRRHGRHHFIVVWGVTSVLLVAMMAAWSLSTPVPSGPDEPAQYVAAAGMAHGSLYGRPAAGVTRAFTLPGTFTNLYSSPAGCYYGKPAVPAGCTYLRGSFPQEETVGTYVPNYSPLYYGLTGLPSLVSSQFWALRAMRLVSVVIVALLLGLALAAAVVWSRMPWLVVGVAVAITPLALYLGAVINPSGMEIAGAIAAWTTLVALVFTRSGDPPAGLVWAWGVGSSAFILSRPLSPLFFLCVVAGVVAFRPRRALVLARFRSVRRAASVTAALVVGQLLYELANKGFAEEKFLLPPGTSIRTIVTLILGLIPKLARGTIGGYGSPDTAAPPVVVIVWFFAAALLVGAVVVAARRREVVLLGLIVVATLVIVPSAADLYSARSIGLDWQGRYGLPLAVGIPILAAAVLGERRVRLGGVPAVLFSSLAVGQLVSWYWVLRRYTVGLG